MESPIIRKTLLCAKCGYDLEGLPARGNCPECGTQIVESLAARLDPEAERFAEQLGGRAGARADRMRLAWALFLASLGELLGCAIVVAPALSFAATWTRIPAWLAPGLDGIRAVAPHVALVGAAIGCVATLGVLPWRRDRDVVRARILGGGGFALWTVAALMAPSPIVAASALLPASMAIIGLAPILRALAPHSRHYRTARHATQTTRDLLFAAALAGIAGFVAQILALQKEADLAPYFAVAAGGSAMLFVVGIAYRAVNALWILRAIRRPAPTVAEVLDR